MDIKEIIWELNELKIIDSKTVHYQSLNGGTVSRLYLLFNSDGPRYVVKMNEPLILQSEASFLSIYGDIDLLPKLIYVEPANKYMVYNFISGSTQYPNNNKKEVLQSLVTRLINQYDIVPNDSGWGWADEVTDSWTNFLLSRAVEANQVLKGYLGEEDFDLVCGLIESQDKNYYKPFLLHGDCGVHNFIFEDGRLCGVIDPTPIIGDPLYDLIYAFCSSPDDLTKETIGDAASLLLNSEKKFLYQDVLIGLYFRIGTCIKHHPNDFKDYHTAWNYWKKIAIL